MVKNNKIHKKQRKDNKPVTKSFFYNGMQIRRLIFLHIITLGLFDITWFYRNWKFLKTITKKTIRPGWRTVCLFVPFYNFWLMYDQFRSITKLANTKKIKTQNPGTLFSMYFLFLFADNILGRILPEKYSIYSIVFNIMAFLPLINVQKYINAIFSKTKEKYKKENKHESFTTGEIIWIIVGALIWLLILLGTFVLSID